MHHRWLAAKLSLTLVLLEHAGLAAPRLTSRRTATRASAAQTETYRQARLTQIDLLEAGWDEMMEERACLMDTPADPGSEGGVHS